MSESAIMLLISICGALGTLVGTVWTVRGMLARFETKLAVIEEKLSAAATRSARHSDKINEIERRLIRAKA